MPVECVREEVAVLGARGFWPRSELCARRAAECGDLAFPAGDEVLSGDAQTNEGSECLEVFKLARLSPAGSEPREQGSPLSVD